MSDVGINLLPWRQRDAIRRRRRYFASLGLCALLPGLAVALLTWHTRMEVDAVRAEMSTYRQAAHAGGDLADLTSRASQLEGQIQDLQAWQVEIDQLDQQRTSVVALWTELATLLPDSMHYRNLTLEDRSLEIQGFTASSPDLATYLRRLEASQVLDSPRLIDLEDEASGKRFGVQTHLRMQEPSA